MSLVAILNFLSVEIITRMKLLRDFPATPTPVSWMSRCARDWNQDLLANRIAQLRNPEHLKKIVKTSQRIERNLGLRFESCDFKSLRIGAIRSAANCALRIGTSKHSIFSKVLPYKWEAYCRTNGRRIVWVSLSSRFRSQEGPAIEMGGVLPYKLERCTAVLPSRPVGVLVSETLLKYYFGST